MGNELGQLYEWSEAGTLDWALVKRPFHRFFHSLCKTYVENPALQRVLTRRIISGGRKIMRMHPAYSA